MPTNLKKLMAVEDDIADVVYVNLEGEEHKLRNQRFPNGKSVPILQEVLSLASQINLKDHWTETQRQQRGEQATFDTLLASLGPAPDSDSGDYEAYHRRRMALQMPRGVTNILIEKIVPDLLQVAQAAPQTLYKIAAYATLPAKDLQKADERGNLPEVVHKQMKYLEWNFDLTSLIPVFSALPRLSGVEDFLSKAGIFDRRVNPFNQVNQESEEAEETTTPSTDSPTP